MLLVVQNDPHCPAGRYADLLDAWGVRWGLWSSYSGKAPPNFAVLAGVVVLGGFLGVRDLEHHRHLQRVRAVMAGLVERDIPQLGICLGGQLLAAVLGGVVRAGKAGEHGCRDLHLTEEGRVDPLFAGLAPGFPVFQWHNDSFAVPQCARHLARSGDCPGQALRYGRAWGIQFHPEVTAGIVEDWQCRGGTDAGCSSEFRRREQELAVPATRILENFLAVANVRERPGSGAGAS